jgi:putative solute:sodium symporter small subunit
MTDHEKYNVNFFKPLSDHAKANKKLIIILATIWFVSVFGFQFLLIALNEPTPEKAYTTYQEILPQINADQGLPLEQKQELAKCYLFVLGKNVALKDDHKAKLQVAFSTLVNSMVPDSLGASFKQEPGDESIALAKGAIGLSDEGFDKLMSALLTTSLIKVDPSIKSVPVEEISEIMKLYLVHNRNAFTDFEFIGFPFHYWYTAQFLLILFVVLCLIYAVVIDKTNTKFDFVEET